MTTDLMNSTLIVQLLTVYTIDEYTLLTKFSALVIFLRHYMYVHTYIAQTLKIISVHVKFLVS